MRATRSVLTALYTQPAAGTPPTHCSKPTYSEPGPGHWAWLVGMRAKRTIWKEVRCLWGA